MTPTAFLDLSPDPQATTHHPLGASSWGAADLCPARVTEQARLRQGESAAVLGDETHGLADTGQEGTGYARVLAYRFRCFVEDAKAEIPQTCREDLTEERLEVKDPETGEVLTWGAADRVCLFETGALICDLKTHRTGYIPEHVTRYQLILLAVGALQRWPELRSVRASAYAAATDTAFVMAKLKREEVPWWIDKWKEVRDRVLADAPEYNPGIEQCAYCKAVHVCPAVQSRVPALVDVLSAGGKPLVREHGGTFEIADHEGFARWWAQVKAVEAALPKAKVLARGVLSQCESPYLELRASGNSRQIVDRGEVLSRLPGEVVASLEKALLRTFGISDIQASLVEGLGLSAKAAKSWIDDHLDDVLRARPRAPSVQKKKGTEIPEGKS